jgi:hypothetical protein
MKRGAPPSSSIAIQDPFPRERYQALLPELDRMALAMDAMETFLKKWRVGRREQQLSIGKVESLMTLNERVRYRSFQRAIEKERAVLAVKTTKVMREQGARELEVDVAAAHRRNVKNRGGYVRVGRKESQDAWGRKRLSSLPVYLGGGIAGGDHS